MEKIIKGTSVSIINSWVETIDKIIPEGTLGNEGEEKDAIFSCEEELMYKLLVELFPNGLGKYLENKRIRCVYLRSVKADLASIKKIVEPFLTSSEKP